MVKIKKIAQNNDSPTDDKRGHRRRLTTHLLLFLGVLVVAAAAFTGTAAAEPVKIGVSGNDVAADVIENDPEINAVPITNSELDNTYDAFVCVRCNPGSNVEGYVENGSGGYVGEWRAVLFPINQGWVSGTTGLNDDNLTNLNRLENPNNPLFSAISWSDLDFSSPGIQFAHNISINDPDAETVAFADHSRFGTIPFVTTKPNPFGGDGNIVLSNFDWQDSYFTGSDSMTPALNDSIQEFALFAANGTSSVAPGPGGDGTDCVNRRSLSRGQESQECPTDREISRGGSRDELDRASGRDGDNRRRDRGRRNIGR
jgi:hypothetical protein